MTVRPARTRRRTRRASPTPCSGTSSTARASASRRSSSRRSRTATRRSDGTVLPVNLAVGATWDPDLLRAGRGRTPAAELRARGGHLALVSALDLAARPALGPRRGVLRRGPAIWRPGSREALVRGMQAGRASARGAQALRRTGRHGRRAATARRTELGPRELHEIHLPAARAGVRAGAAGVMAAYNEVDGLPCAADRYLLTGLLRERWGFDGIVMADGFAVDRLTRLRRRSRRRRGALALRGGRRSEPVGRLLPTRWRRPSSGGSSRRRPWTRRVAARARAQVPPRPLRAALRRRS